MANLTESPIYETGIFQLEKSTPPLGGAPVIDNGVPRAGHANVQAQQLANRTANHQLRLNQAESDIDVLQDQVTAGGSATTLKSDLANQTDVNLGAGLLGWDGGPLTQQLSLSKKLTNYADMIAYTGTATRVEIVADGISGIFNRKDFMVGDGEIYGIRFLSADGRYTWNRNFDGQLKLKWGGAKGDGVTVDTNAIRNFYDSALKIVKTTPYTSVTVLWPQGNFIVDDELLSDGFQAAWWDQENLGATRAIATQGEGPESTIITIRNWKSGVRNTANGNLRTYGPWANSPSPSILFPTLASVARGNPSSFSLRGLKIFGSDKPGKDPIVRVTANEINSINSEIYANVVSNSGEVIMGSFNALYTDNRYHSCGAQPVEGGSILGSSAGFPTPRVSFNLTSSGTISAFATASFGGYSDGQAVPYFNSTHVGKTFIISMGAIHDTTAQPAKVTITAVASGGLTATVVAQGATLRSANNLSGSFTPVKFTSVADSPNITLSSPILFGNGKSDMEGMLVWLPKAGSKANSSVDVMCTRILACTTGDNINGYTGITLAHPARFSATDIFVTSASHAPTVEESLKAITGTYNHNDSDFVKCRWECEAGYGDDRTTSGLQFISSYSGGHIQYTSCKIHGSTYKNNSASECQVIIDNSLGIGFIGCDFVHFGLTGNGSVRLMGISNIVDFVSAGLGGWQVTYDYKGLYFDPMVGYNPSNWKILDGGLTVACSPFPVLSQSIFSGSSTVNPYKIKQFTNNSTPYRAATLLTASDNLNDVNIAGDYYWLVSAPINATLYGSFSSMTVSGQGSRVLQSVYDHDNDWQLDRNNNNGSFGPWRMRTIRNTTTGALTTASNDIQYGKFSGQQVFNTSNNIVYMATGGLTTSPWVSVDGTKTITPN